MHFPFPSIPLRLCLVALSLLSTYPLHADDVRGPDGKILPGHSSHGEAFNEGPRQAARLIAGTGLVSLKVTTGSAEAQQFFDQGLGQLHGFWFFEAERSFRQVAKCDDQCAMAYWGMAMANFSNRRRGVEFIQKAAALKERASKLEQRWIAALESWFDVPKKDSRDAKTVKESKEPKAKADDKSPEVKEKKAKDLPPQRDEKQRRTELVKALEKLSFDFPENIEIKAFLAMHIWDNSTHGVPVGSHQAVDALVRQIFAVNPMHPAHHYIIHLWNHEDDRRALTSAASCGQSAPGIAHMWHMPGHTYVKLDRFSDAAWQQEASARADHAHMLASRLLPEEIHNYAHNNDWLVENLSFVGRIRDAVDLAQNMIELPRLAKGRLPVGRNAARGYANTAHTMGSNRLMEVTLEYELWDVLRELEGSMYLAEREDPLAEASRLRALAAAHFQKGAKARGKELLTALEGDLKKARDARMAAADEAEQKARDEKKNEDDIAKVMTEALKSFSSRIRKTESFLAESRAYAALADGDVAKAKTEIGKIVDLPATRKARLLLQAEDRDGALKAAEEAVKKNANRVVPLAVLAHVQWKMEKKKEALETFQKLRAISSELDIAEPPFARLTPLAREAGLTADWREKATPATDVGTRPSLATLGPFRWTPWKAPAWELPDQDGFTRTLSEWKGKPLLVVFYLGSGCSHCIEQLNLITPLTAGFQKAGIEIVAVSTDKADELHKTNELVPKLPYPIIADPGLDTFKKYLAYDDFENVPLHGVFLIDAAGYVRWRDISHKPFGDIEWLLGESRRLLELPVRPSESSGVVATPKN